MTDEELKSMSMHWERLMERRARDLLHRLDVPVTSKNLEIARADIEVVDLHARRDAVYYVNNPEALAPLRQHRAETAS